MGRMEQDAGSGSQSKHQCEVGGCSKEGTHSMVGLNGTMEYYCTEHYNEMAEIMQMLTGEVKSIRTFSGSSPTCGGPFPL